MYHFPENFRSRFDIQIRDRPHVNDPTKKASVLVTPQMVYMTPCLKELTGMLYNTLHAIKLF